MKSEISKKFSLRLFDYLATHTLKFKIKWHRRASLLREYKFQFSMTDNDSQCIASCTFITLITQCFLQIFSIYALFKHENEIIQW